MKMNDKEYKVKQAEMHKNHPDRLFEYKQNLTYGAKEKIEAMIKEARSKGYTIIPADGGKNNDGKLMQGIVLFKEIDGIELAYNPIWELGSLGVDTNTLLGITADSNIKTPADFWMEDVRSLTVDVSELVEKGLKEYGIILTPEQEDKIHNIVWEVLESVSNGDYRSYN